MTFYWWDDAVDHALQLARDTQIRHRVYKSPRGWKVRPAFLLLEVVS